MTIKGISLFSLVVVMESESEKEVPPPRNNVLFPFLTPIITLKTVVINFKMLRIFQFTQVIGFFFLFLMPLFLHVSIFVGKQMLRKSISPSLVEFLFFNVHYST